MSLKSIRESYSKFLNTLNESGVKLNESSKPNLDNFIMTIESSMTKQRESAIRKTKKVVTEKLEAEFKELFESTFKTLQENNAIASKIEKLSVKMDESKKIAEKVDSYLDSYIETVLPKKTIVDYDRMQKLEKIQESLKDMLVVDDAAIEAKQKAIAESMKTEKSKCETEVAKMQVKLDESTKKIEKLTKKLEGLKAIEVLENKTKNLPDFEAHAMKKRLAESSEKEIEENFDKTLDEVRENAKKLAECGDKDIETTLESEIDQIVGEDDIQEDDMLKTTPHNGDAQHNAHIEEKEGLNAEDVSEGTEDVSEGTEDVSEEEFETMETIKEDTQGNIELDESDIIDEDLMKLWCNQAIEVR